MVFAAPLWLLGLLAVPLLAAWGVRRARARRAVGLAFPATADAAALPAAGWARWRGLPAGLRLAALALALVAMARPQARDVLREQTAEGLDIVLVLDLSTSMLADDFYPNRFEAARRVAGEFVDGRTSDRIGLVVFAAQAYTQAPLTLDYPFLKQMLRDVELGLTEDGTAIGTAIATATARLTDDSTAADRGKVMILLTDGQNNRGAIDPATAAEVAEAMGVRIYAIGVGGGGGRTRRSPFGGGALAVPEIDEATLRAVAARTGGRYFRATDAEALRSIYAAISELERTEIEEHVTVEVDERFALALWPALALLLAAEALAATRLRRVP